MENEELECFAAAFRISPYIVFEVRYNHVGNNQEADFATLAEVLNRRKSDYTQCGQCQDSVLPEGSPALAFYQKWDSKHLSKLSDEEYNEMKSDLQGLQSKYPNIYKVGNDDIRFSEIVDLSKQKSIKESKLEEGDSNMGEYDLRNLILEWCDNEEDIRYMDVDEVVNNYTDTLISSEDIGKYGFDGQADYDTIRNIVQEEVESYIDEHNNIYTMAEEYDGTGATDYLDGDEWKEIFENAPETYKEALRARLNYFDGVQEMPDVVWNWLMDSVDEQIGFVNFSPDVVIDNVLYNGEYGEFDDYKEEDESDEEFIAREEDNCIAIFPEERFIIYSL